MNSLQEEVKTLKMEHRKAKDEIIADFTREKRQFDEKISRKESELEIVRHELNQVKEFRKKKNTNAKNNNKQLKSKLIIFAQKE